MIDALFRTLLGQLAPAGARGRLSTLIFHRVLRAPDPLLPELPDARQFEAQMRWVRAWFNVLPLHEAVERLQHKALPARALSITFDDGYVDNAEVAAPILKRLGLHATFFVATGFLDGRNMWNDRVIEAIRACPHASVDLRQLGLGVEDLGSAEKRRDTIRRLLRLIKHQQPPKREAAVRGIEEACTATTTTPLMMRPEHVARLAASGFDVGAHTVTHPILSRLTTEDARREVAGSKADVEAIIGRPARLFAYPNGVPNQDYTAEHVALVRKCGFVAAAATVWGVAAAGADVFQLPRFTPWDRTRARFGARLARNLSRSRFATA